VDEVPQKFKTIGIVQLVAGLVNVFMGWGIAWFGWSMVGMLAGTVCSAVTLFMCPLTYLLYMCGFLGFLVIPIGIAEAVVGLVALTNPAAVKGAIPYLAMAQIPCILLGDIVSPIAGIVSYMMAKDPEVAGYIQGM
jgi:hypothetical protein